MDLAQRVAHRLKLRDLALFERVVRSGSIARAATWLNLTQPAVSKAVSALEHTLGVPLLERGRQGVRVTEYGEVLLKCGVAVFDEVRQGVRQIEFVADPRAGEVRIGASAPVIAGLLPMIIVRHARLYPRVTIHVMHSDIGRGEFRELRERYFDL